MDFSFKSAMGIGSTLVKLTDSVCMVLEDRNDRMLQGVDTVPGLFSGQNPNFTFLKVTSSPDKGIHVITAR